MKAGEGEVWRGGGGGKKFDKGGVLEGKGFFDGEGVDEREVKKEMLMSGGEVFFEEGGLDEFGKGRKGKEGGGEGGGGESIRDGAEGGSGAAEKLMVMGDGFEMGEGLGGEGDFFDSLLVMKAGLKAILGAAVVGGGGESDHKGLGEAIIKNEGAKSGRVWLEARSEKTLLREKVCWRAKPVSAREERRGS